MNIEFKGKVYDTEKVYIDGNGTIFWVNEYQPNLGYLFVTEQDGDGESYTNNYTNNPPMFDISLIALPEKVKIVPEKGKIYCVSNSIKDIYYLEFNGYDAFEDHETIIHTKSATIHHEMVEKNG